MCRMVSIHPEAVLHDAYYRPVELVDVYVSVVKEKKETSRIVKQLCIDLPLHDLLHLKRVKASGGKDGSLQVVVCPKGLNSLLDEETLEILKKDIYKHLGHIYLVKVPRYPPLTRQQYRDSIQNWPVNFHEDKRVKKLLERAFFSETELKSICQNMEQAIKCAHISKEREQLPIGAVIVNPKQNQVIAKSHDNRLGNHPLQHAVMVCIDMVARSQGGGMWDIPCTGTTCDGYKTEAVSPDKCEPSQRETDNVNKVEKQEQKDCDSDIQCSCPSYARDSSNEDPYLCSGYDLYVTREPCVMCAMALVHARISRVFYGSSHKDGALGSKVKLHTQKGLNHHYEVFTNVLTKECEKLVINR